MGAEGVQLLTISLHSPIFALRDLFPSETFHFSFTVLEKCAQCGLKRILMSLIKGF